MQPLLLQGGPVYSPFRLQNLESRVRQELDASGRIFISAQRVFILHTEPGFSLSSPAGRQTKSLLGADECLLSTPVREGFFVTPRKGSISPWSSKATSIFHNCGLQQIKRVEHGLHLQVQSSARQSLSLSDCTPCLDLLHDRMTEGCYLDLSDFFDAQPPRPSVIVPIQEQGIEALRRANEELGLALSTDEVEYLYQSFLTGHRNPTDAELVMFAQVNSEHCRHKIFNAAWIIDGEEKKLTLFDMIRNTHRLHPDGTLVAYKDNSGVVEGFRDKLLEVRPDAGHTYTPAETRIDLVMKVETHNHPTAISPYPGAATGVGGEIRDEVATGTGGRAKAGLCAFMVSNLRIPGFIMPWEQEYAEFPSRLATPLQIMTEAPIGGAGFGNEFGRPALCGLFRTYEEVTAGRYRGYHKPIMAAGGMGNIKRGHVHKHSIPPGACIIQIGGPAMRIGLGGGAASSMATGSNATDLDFNSVQRDNAEMQRRCQGVVDACTGMGTDNPILSIHDIGAGGLSNACPELIAETGGKFYLRRIDNEESSMNPMEIWCCEAQERYVLAIAPESLPQFEAACRRERCPASVIGHATGDGRLTLFDEHFDDYPIDMDISVLLGKPPKMVREVSHESTPNVPLDLNRIDLKEAVERILRLPAVAAKNFLITIADRSVSGLVTRDQMVGPYQTPVADTAVTATTYGSLTGEAMAMGERPIPALISPAASGRMAVGEALTNIAAANIGPIGNIKLSANWMCGCGESGEDAALYDTVTAVGMELCPALGIAIPVGKDSLSMRSQWRDCRGREHKITAPLTLLISAFAPVRNVKKTITPELQPEADSRLLLIDLGERQNRLGGSALAQVYNQIGNVAPDLDDPARFKRFFAAVQQLLEERLLLAYHDRSDGGLFVTLTEMAFAARAGIQVDISSLLPSAEEADAAPGLRSGDPHAELITAALFNEELGAVIQIAAADLSRARQILTDFELQDIVHDLGHPTTDRKITIRHQSRMVYQDSVSRLNRSWSEMTCRMQELRDHPDSARQEFDNLLDEDDPGIGCRLTYDPEAGNFNLTGRARPPMAILREQGVNGQSEMAAAFTEAGFECRDVHMTDLFTGIVDLADFKGLVACGGFSYGDVLGAGAGWAKSILYNEKLKVMFQDFFTRSDTFSLGVCNGCQMLSRLQEIIPGAESWPRFVGNASEQFESRYIMVEILDSPSLLLKGMQGSQMPVPVAHGEGRIDFTESGDSGAVEAGRLGVLRYVDNYGRPTERYPYNPNGSPRGLNGFTTIDGRVTIMMPHPERAFKSVQLSWRPRDWTADDGPWMRLFRNARDHVA